MRFTAEQCAEWALIAYKRDNESEQSYRSRAKFDLEQEGFKAVEFWDTKGAQSFTGLIDDVPVWVYRGTDSVSDIITDLFAMPSFDSVVPGSVHKGFRGQSIRLRNQAYEPAEGEECWYIGHSLGGALATINGERDAHERGSKSHIVTFGAPRSAGRSFYRNSKGEVLHWRFENRADLIPKLPPPGIFVHGVGALFFDRSGSLTADPSRFTRCWESLMAILSAIWTWVRGCFRLKTPVVAADHLMASAYVPRIRRAEKDLDGNLLEEYRVAAASRTY